jgi:hypothetical protein
MRLLTLATGLAVGYVLGTRAGREKYDQIAESARNFAEQPTVAQTTAKVKEKLGLSTSGSGNGTSAISGSTAGTRSGNGGRSGTGSRSTAGSRSGSAGSSGSTGGSAGTSSSVGAGSSGSAATA